MNAPTAAVARLSLGKILVNAGKVCEDDLARALQLQKESSEKIGRLLVELGLVAERDYLSALSEQLGLTIVDSSDFPAIPPELPSLSAAFLRNNKIFPFDVVNNRLRLAVVDPLDFETLDSVRVTAGFELDICLAPESVVLDAVERFYGEGENLMGRLAHQFGSVEVGDESGEGPQDAEQLRDMALEAPVIRIVNVLISRAVESGASDIHIEPLENELRVRFRIDGVLYPVESPPQRIKAAIISRTKLMARLNIAERRLPQDGRIQLRLLGHEIDLRVSTLPTIHGESIVMRILDRNDSSLLSLSRLGFPDDMLRKVEKLTALPHGIFLVTGPTGSGKTTTLYGALNQLNRVERNVITLEDPVEYQIGGVNQIHVNPQIGLTFAAGLRHIMRQDPDVIMVGEIRDLETAEIAIRAALTGHLVYSTLHTNDAPSAITRLVDMGVPGYLLSSSLIAVLAQRLVRVLCESCKQEYDGADEVPENFLPANRPVKIYRSVGCEQCRGTGFLHRIGIFELMEVDETLRRLISKCSESNVLRDAAVASGMITLREAGWKNVVQGTTTVEEVLRVTQAMS